MRRAGKNDGTGKQSGALAQKFDERWNVAHHVARVAVLHHAAVYRGLDAEPARIRNLVRSYKARTDGGECIEAFSTAPLAAALFQLPVAGANVVAAGVAGDVVERLLPAYVFADFADDDDEFALIIQF